MPVGMTLQQLYAQPAFHGETSSGVGVPTASSSMSMANANAMNISSSVSAASAKRTASPPLHDSKEYAPRALHDGGAYPPEPRSQPPPQPPQQYTTDHHAASLQQQHYPHAAYGQLPPPHAYAQYHPKPSSSLPPPSHNAADEYVGIADPLPFEYMGMRKFPDALKDHADHRYQYQGTNYNQHSPHPSVYESQHAHPPKSVEERAYHQPYVNDRGYHHHPQQPSHANEPPTGPFGHHATTMPPHLYANNQMTQPAPTPTPQYQHQQPHHAFPPPIDTQTAKKDAEPQAYSPHGPVEFSSTPPGPQSAGQEAVIKVKTPLKAKYWRNGRRNLQCFPSCKVFGDYSSIKIEDLKQHDFMWGKCRGSLITEVTLNSSVSFDDILILSRVHSMENVPVAFEEAVIRECMLGRMLDPDVMDAMKDQWITGERLPDFVQQESNTACYEFKPKVWKYTEDMTQGKCKRRNVKYYVQFEAFVLVMSGERRYYACIGSGMSTAFEVGSSRVLARQKRKAATGLDANPLYLKNGQAVGSPTEVNPPPPMQQHHPMMQQPHPMMPHAMHQHMYPPSYPQHAYPPARGLPQGMHPSMMPPPMHHGDGSGQMHPGYQHQHQQQPQLQAPMAPLSAPQAGQKRKAAPTNAQRATKAKKVAKEAAAPVL